MGWSLGQKPRGATLGFASSLARKQQKELGLAFPSPLFSPCSFSASATFFDHGECFNGEKGGNDLGWISQNLLNKTEALSRPSHLRITGWSLYLKKKVKGTEACPAPFLPAIPYVR